MSDFHYLISHNISSFSSGLSGRQHWQYRRSVFIYDTFFLRVPDPFLALQDPDASIKSIFVTF